MKAIVFEGQNKGLNIEEIDEPIPKDDEVLIKVAACGVCHTDLHVIEGDIAFPTPAVLGHEISGVVKDVGANVSSVKEGDRVVSPFIMPCGHCIFCRQGRDDLCENFFRLNRLQGKLYDGNTRLFRKDKSPIWMYSMGGLAEYAVVPQTSVFILPDSVDLYKSCILGCAAFTAYGAVVNQGNVSDGDSVAVIAVGGVGMSIIQIAKSMGASQILAVDINDDKLKRAKELGADLTINSKEVDADQEIFKKTDGRGADVAFEVLGKPDTILTAFNSVRDGGKVVAVGIAGQKKTVEIDITRLVRRGIKIFGSYGARTRTDMPKVVELAKQGKLDIEKTVSKVYKLEETSDAYLALNKGEIVGRAIIKVS